MPNATSNGLAIERPLELILVALVTSALAGLFLAVIGIFMAPQAIIIGLGGAVIYWYISRGRSPSRPPTTKFPTWQVLGLLLLAVFFRLPFVNYVSGGQDQGVYVNVAAHIVHTGGIAVQNRVLDRLDGTAASDVYSRENAPINGDFLPGLFQESSESGGGLEFQFYHLFPVLMALVGGTLGLDASVFALTLLSILSILFFYCVAFEISRRKDVAFGAAALLAVNPLHAFFSRFPVTEVPTLCFTLGGAWLLMRAWRHRSSDDSGLRTWSVVLLSAGAMGCAFLTRMTGFMYIPMVMLIGMAAAAHEKDYRSRKILLTWVVLVSAAYAASVVYGYAYSSIYVSFHHNYAFGKLLGENWSIWILVIWALALLGIGGMSVAGPERSAGLRRVLEFGRSMMGPLVAAALVLAAYRLYVMGWTDRYVADPWWATRWKIAGTEWGVLKSSSLVVAAEYLGPLVMILFLGLAWSRRLPGRLSLLLAFVLMFHVYLAGMQWLIPYQPYYARYLVSEYVPYLLLFVVTAVPYISSGKVRFWAIVALVISGVYATALSVGQLRANEQHGMAQSYERIASRVGDDDLLLLDNGTLPLPFQLVQMPFMMRYDRDVARVSRQSLSNTSYLNDLQLGFDRLFLLSGSAVAPPGFVPVDAVRFHEWVAEQGRRPPIKSMERFHGLTYLYVRPEALMVPGTWVEFGKIKSNSQWRTIFAEGWGDPEPWGTWSVSASAALSVPRVLADGSRTTRLELAVKPFTTSTHPTQRMRVKVGGAIVYEGEIAAPLTLDIPLPGAQPGEESAGPLYVHFDFPDAITPGDAGLVSDDPRHLGVGLTSARLLTGPESEAAR